MPSRDRPHSPARDLPRMGWDQDWLCQALAHLKLFPMGAWESVSTCTALPWPESRQGGWHSYPVRQPSGRPGTPLVRALVMASRPSRQALREENS